MKTETNQVVKNQGIEELLKETNETLAKHLAQEMLDGKVKNFSVVDLWKIERNSRSTQNLRRWLN
jgi:hypothetical protein